MQRYKNVYTEANVHLPQNAVDQLRMAIHAAFESWNSKSAQRYRSVNNATELLGAAITVQVWFQNPGELRLQLDRAA